MATNCCSIALLSLLACAVAAQDFRGRVQGVVTDASNAAVPQATVTLTNSNTKISTVRNVDASGRYLFDFVEPGVYTLTTESAGFGRFLQENIQVLVR
ncbi:MAG TPA: carboxypeptidase-like regulatory domain-containing protein, partial [Bryobacteraceae bacterium]|nr:carboxypeptidase-like regulatory domain-containing protein [Bryobacteraceae bacterium]